MGGTTRKATKPSEVVQTATIETAWQRILRQATREEASDIHVEPESDKLVIRYRRHGLLSSPTVLPGALAQPLARYLKAQAQLDTKQTRIAQTGNFVQTSSRHNYELSLATMPVLVGERLVVHVHDPAATPPSLQALGLWGAGLKHVQQALTQPRGLILVSGPNHSGLSTTLASLAATVAHPAHRVA